MIKNTRHLLLFLFVMFPSSLLAGGGPPAIVQVEKAVNIEISPSIWVTGTVIGRYDSRIAAEVEVLVFESIQ